MALRVPGFVVKVLLPPGNLQTFSFGAALCSMYEGVEWRVEQIYEMQIVLICLACSCVKHGAALALVSLELCVDLQW